MDESNMFFRKNLLKHLQRCEVTPGTLSNANRDVAQVDEPPNLRAWPGKNGKATHRVEIRDKLAHSGPSITRRPPLAGRVHHLHLLNKGEVLRAAFVLVSMVTGDGVHHVRSHERLETLVLEKTFIQCNPFLQ